jgi:hypothetical protein
VSITLSGRIKAILPDTAQEHQVISLFIEWLREARSVDAKLLQYNEHSFPDFVLRNLPTGDEMWVEVVAAVESEGLIALEARARRLYEAEARARRARGEEGVLHVSPRGVESWTPSPGHDVSGVIMPGGLRRISPNEWVERAFKHKASTQRYGHVERTRTTLLIDCSKEVLIRHEDVSEIVREFDRNALGFKEVFCVSTIWDRPKVMPLG